MQGEAVFHTHRRIRVRKQRSTWDAENDEGECDNDDQDDLDSSALECKRKQYLDEAGRRNRPLSSDWSKHLNGSWKTLELALSALARQTCPESLSALARMVRHLSPLSFLKPQPTIFDPAKATAFVSLPSETYLDEVGGVWVCVCVWGGERDSW